MSLTNYNPNGSTDPTMRETKKTYKSYLHPIAQLREIVQYFKNIS